MNGKAIASTVALAFLAAGCSSGSGGTAKAVTPAPAATTSPTAQAVTTAPAAKASSACPVTRPKNGPSAVPKEAMFGWENAYGDEKLVVGGLGEDGIIKAGPDFIAPDGSIGMKFGWWRGVPGDLRITGRRIDGQAQPLRSSVPTGYGDRGFQSSGVYFPTAGCWEVTGAVGKTRLTFVTYVIKM